MYKVNSNSLCDMISNELENMSNKKQFIHAYVNKELYEDLCKVKNDEGVVSSKFKKLHVISSDYRHYYVNMDEDSFEIFEPTLPVECLRISSTTQFMKDETFKINKEEGEIILNDAFKQLKGIPIGEPMPFMPLEPIVVYDIRDLIDTAIGIYDDNFYEVHRILGHDIRRGIGSMGVEYLIFIPDPDLHEMGLCIKIGEKYCEFSRNEDCEIPYELTEPVTLYEYQQLNKKLDALMQWMGVPSVGDMPSMQPAASLTSGSAPLMGGINPRNRNRNRFY